MAAIRKLRGRWQAQVRRRGLPPRAKSFDFKADAERWARELESMLDRGAFGFDTRKAEQTTFREIMERYVSEITPTKKGAVAERARILSLLRSNLMHYTLATLTSEKIASFRDTRLQTVSAGTVNRELSIFSHAIDTARREWGIQVVNNPINLVKRPATPRARQRRLEGTEHLRLLEVAKASRNPVLAPLITFAIETGMRRSEILSLRWSLIHFERRTAHLPDTKNGDSRDVPLSSTAIKVLQDIWATTKTNETDKTKCDIHVFQISPAAVSQAWKRIVNRAKISGLTFHDLRHEATSRLFELGLNPMEVSAITGHRSFETLRRYTHLRADGLAERLG